MKPTLPILATCAAALLVLPACQNVPKYKRSNGRFDEWGSYEGKNFKPSHGIATAVDLTAQTITITQGDESKVFVVTPDTRIMHDGTDITLADLPANQAIRFTFAEDRKHLITVWYGTHLNTWVGHSGSARRH